jgi:microcystin degradation protein MlrC
MRIAIGRVSHETNTFRPGVTDVSAFQAMAWERGDEILAAHRGVRDDLGGMIAGAERLGVEVAPTFSTTAEPSATIARDAYETIRDELFAAIRAAGPVDAICLALHGAGSAEGIDDVEGTLLGELRAVVGKEVPIVVTLDLHGNMTPAMVEHADILLNCHEYPHVDMYDRGVEAVELAVKLVRGEIDPVRHLEIVAMVLPPVTTVIDPGLAINRACFAWEARPGIIDCAFVHGFPHTDVPIVHASVLATADGDADLARAAAQDIARRLWEGRDAFRDELPDVDEALRLALASAARPVVIAEVSDNSGGGAPADGTHLLRALLAANVPESCFGFLADPETARQAHQAGVGATIDVRLGGKTDDLHGEPIATRAYVKCLTDGRFRYTTPMGAGAQEDLGLMARLVIGNVDLLVSSIRSQTLDDEVFLLHGIDVRRYRLVALKSMQHFRAGFMPLAGAIIRTDPPGSTTSNLARHPFRRLSRPVWPLDDDASWTPANSA